MRTATIIKPFPSNHYTNCPPKNTIGIYLGEIDFEYNDNIMHRVQFANEILRFKSHEIKISA